MLPLFPVTFGQKASLCNRKQRRTLPCQFTEIRARKRKRHGGFSKVWCVYAFAAANTSSSDESFKSYFLFMGTVCDVWLEDQKKGATSNDWLLNIIISSLPFCQFINISFFVRSLLLSPSCQFVRRPTSRSRKSFWRKSSYYLSGGWRHYN